MANAQLDFTTNFSLPYLLPAQAQKHVTVNESLAAIDALLMAHVLDINVSDPPGTPENGDAYLVSSAPTGDWVGHPGELAVWLDGAWQYYLPKAGWRIWNQQADQLYVFDGTGWRALPDGTNGFQNMPLLGIGTTADVTNPLSVRGPGALLTARDTASGGTGDFRLALNAEAGAHSASILFQSGWSGRGEIGLTNDGLLAMRTSADGTTWMDAVQVDPSDGHIGLGIAPESAQPVTIADLARIVGSNGNLLLRDNGSIDMTRDGGGSIYLRARSEGSQLHLGVTNSSGSLITTGFVMRPNTEDIVLGFDLVPSSSGSVDLGKASQPFGDCYLTNAPTISSDRRGKIDIETFDAGLDVLQAMNPVTFRRRGSDPRRHVGLIAQHVREVLQDNELLDSGIWSLADPDDPQSPQAVSYTELVPVLIDAVNELAERVEALEARRR